jgi:hypothetical protein
MLSTAQRCFDLASTALLCPAHVSTAQECLDHVCVTRDNSKSKHGTQTGKHQHNHNAINNHIAK